jgi:hypothetical protein
VGSQTFTIDNPVEVREYTDDGAVAARPSALWLKGTYHSTAIHPRPQGERDHQGRFWAALWGGLI